MRIISGKYKGRILATPKNFKARPTTDRARESLFNILNNRVDFEELKVLDLFSGTGSVGFEFISRGCEYVEMLEKNYTHFQHLQKIKHELGIENLRIIKGDFFNFIKKSNDPFDLVFADPPFDLADFESIPGLVLNSRLLKKEGIFILEHSKNYNFSNIDGFEEQRNYGGVNFSFFTKT